MKTKLPGHWIIKIIIIFLLIGAYLLTSLGLYYFHQNLNFTHTFTFYPPLDPEHIGSPSFEGQSLDIKEIYVSGNFIGWEKKVESYKMNLTPEGYYQLTTPVLSGRTEYKFVVYLKSRPDPLWIHDPENPNQVSDGHSGVNSYFDTPDTWAMGDNINLVFFLLALFYILYLLLDLISLFVFRYGLGPKSRTIVLLWLVILITFAIGTYRGIWSEKKWSRWLLEDSLNMVHRIMEGNGLEFSALEKDETRKLFLDQSRKIMISAIPRTLPHTFQNSEIFMETLFLLGPDLKLLGVVQSDETRRNDLALSRKLGYPRIQNLLDEYLLPPVRTTFLTNPPPRGMLSFHLSPKVYRQEKGFSYDYGSFFLGYNMVLKPIYYNTTEVGYYGAIIAPQVFGKAIIDIILFHGSVAFLLSVLILAYFSYWKVHKPEHNFLLDRFIQRFDLSPREAQIIKLYYNGYSTVYIAKKFEIHSGTVKSHIHSVYQKAGVGQKVELLQLIQDLD